MQTPAVLTLFTYRICKHAFAAFFLCTLPVSAAILQGQTQFERIGDNTLIPDNVVTDLAQDQAGYLWIATPAGVVRYDGYRFKLFEHDPEDTSSLGGNFVRNIKVMDDGTLWLSNEPGGVSIYDAATERFRRLLSAETLLSYPNLSSVSQVIRGNDSDVWLSTTAGVFRVGMDGTLIKHYTTEDGLPHNGVRALLRDNQGAIWVGTRAGLVRYDAARDHFEQLKAVSEQGNRALYVRSLFQAENGRLWIGTNSAGLWTYDPQSDRLQPVRSSQPETSQTGSIYDILQFSQDELWIARFGGIDRISAHTGQWLSRIIHDPSDSFSLANNDIRTLLKDQAGNLWVGGYGGGVQRMLSNTEGISTLRFSLLKKHALTEPNVSSVLVLADGTIWVGTRGGGINIVDRDVGVVGGHFPDKDNPAALQAGWITALAQQPDGDIWVGVNPGQLYRFDPDSEAFHRYGPEQGLPRSNIRALAISRRGGVWIGTNAGLLYWDNSTDRVVTYAMQDGQAMLDGINALHEDEQGRLLIATGATGLYEVRPHESAIRAIAGEDEQGRLLQTISIVGMLLDSQHRLWLDTPAGLYLARPTPEGEVSLINHSLLAGYAGRPMGANLLEDARGRLWTPSFIYDPATTTMHPLQQADGFDIGTSWYRAYTQAPDGLMLFGGSRGLLMVEPQNFTFWDYKPPIVVSELHINGKPHNAGQLAQRGLSLRPDQRSFSIEFAALDLSAPQNNRYRYRLEGFDDEWISVDATRRLASYSNLWPGQYTLTVEGTNRAGQWSDTSLSIPVRVNAAFWQTPWFLGAAIVLIVLVIYVGIGIRTRWIQKQAKALELLVEERTAALKKAQNDFIEREKMASLGVLVAGVSHEINTPMGIALTAASGLSDDCDVLLSKVDNNRLKRSELDHYLDKVRASTSIILKSLERACTLIASFKQVAVDQTSEQYRSFRMRTFLEDVEHSLHSLYARGGHRLNITCADDIELESYPGPLFQVFSNLINNSVIHGFNQQQPGTIAITVKMNKDMVVIEYADDGVGMTDEVRKKAFEPFFTTKRGVGGSGLGLHLVYNFVTQLLGGSIRIENKTSRGFACLITIPRVAPRKAQEPEKH
ncbi:hypothetical protein LJ739_18235 [Aestuariibacter halophilus]|uniref:histidine kinase n=1 Tax=Fluctibacter halophilus TaxID=226011 RepID=A0ABS8GDL3_9ALTE|nr:sensor histidine kinase [Aestuariibacter halophilus]MCC2618201.1 hypothetical protein [Aestuariibacter halophilus]